MPTIPYQCHPWYDAALTQNLTLLDMSGIAGYPTTTMMIGINCSHIISENAPGLPGLKIMSGTIGEKGWLHVMNPSVFKPA